MLVPWYWNNRKKTRDNSFQNKAERPEFPYAFYCLISVGLDTKENQLSAAPLFPPRCFLTKYIECQPLTYIHTSTQGHLMQGLCLGATTAIKVGPVSVGTISFYFWANKMVSQQTQAIKTSVGGCQELRLKICACLMQEELLWVSACRVPISCSSLCSCMGQLNLGVPTPPSLGVFIQGQPSSWSCISILLPLLTVQNFTSCSQPWELPTKWNQLLIFPTSAVLNLADGKLSSPFLIPDKTRDAKNQRWTIPEANPAICSQNQGKSQILRTSEYFTQLQMPHRYCFLLLKNPKTKPNKTHTKIPSKWTEPTNTKYKSRKYNTQLLILQWWIFRQCLNRNTSASLGHCLPLACRCGIWPVNKLKTKVDKYLLNKWDQHLGKRLLTLHCKFCAETPPFYMPRDVCISDRHTLNQNLSRQNVIFFSFPVVYLKGEHSYWFGSKWWQGHCLFLPCPGCAQTWHTHTHTHAVCSHIFPPNKFVNADI